ncbi:hypothetical protein GEV33_002427 [Tenebrio molitor]|uniref:Uncharacterized protein n=1 Tax=Tenebrio molitor TaxID=7067 RepID=A0A8J6HT75_TENMO|nr:hypothetical protein GEV33_002427 [Tenebrio molitor]
MAFTEQHKVFMPPAASCEGSPLGGPAAVEAAADSGRDEGKKARKKGDSTDPLERKEENAIKVTYGRKTVTYSVGVRSFFWGATKSQKKSVTPKIRKFRQSWGSKRYGIQHETENHTTLLTGTRKRCHEVHPVAVLLRKRESGIETRTYRLAQKSLTSLGEGKQTLTAVDRRNIENRQARKIKTKGTKMPTPSIIDENHRSRPSPGVSGDEDSHQLGEVSRTERANVRDLANPTVCSYRPAKIVRIRARFQLPLQLGPNEKKTKKSRQGKPKEKARWKGLTTSEREDEGSGRKRTQTKRSRCSSNDGASPSISGTHGPSTPAKSEKTKNERNGIFEP